MFYATWYPEVEQVAAELLKSGLRFPAIHIEKGIGSALGNVQREIREQGIQQFAANCRLGKLLGANALILHLWGMPELDNRLEHNLETLDACLTLASQSDLTLAVETIPARHADPLSNVYRAVAQASSCRVALDTEFLAFYNQIETALTTDWLWQYNTVCHIHIKDFDGTPPFAPGKPRRYLHPGEGYIDFSHFFAGLRQRGFDGYISLEASAIDGTGVVDVNRLRESLATLRRLIEPDPSSRENLHIR